ncbi:histidine kinase [Streptomyces libani]|nr:histidine kinase [Streptomyces libani]MCX5446553.1 histidine kinase [Streptomyces libani]
MWPHGRIVGELLLSVVLGTLAAGIESLRNGGAVQIVAVALAAGLLLQLRRVLPGTVLLVTVVSSAAFAGLAPLTPLVGWSAGRRITGVGRATGTFALAYALSFGLELQQELPRISPAILFVGVLVTLVATVVPGLAGRYWSQRRTLLDTLREYNAQLLCERAMIAGQARMRERQRIAQDMHDSLGHQLALISVHTGALEVDRELTGRQREAVGVLREASVGAMHELREVVGLLRDGTHGPGDGATPSATTGGAPTPALEAMGEEDAKASARGVAGIERLAEVSRSAGTAVELRRSGEVRPLAPTADHAAYRIAQEGLTNAHKHAPGASITIELRYEPDSLVVEVANGPAPGTADDGRSVVSGGQGLTGLGERARLVGGMVHVGPTADGGFRLAGVLTKAMSTDKRSSGIAIGCGVAALIALLVVIGVVVGGVFLMKEMDTVMIEPKEYAAVKVGQSEAEVRKRLPDGSSFLAEGLDKGAPPVPEGAKCLSLNSSEFGSSWEKDPVFRFCFKDGKLIEKKSFEVKA